MPIVDLQAMQFMSIALTGHGMEGNLLDMKDLGGSEAPLAHLA